MDSFYKTFKNVNVSSLISELKSFMLFVPHHLHPILLSSKQQLHVFFCLLLCTLFHKFLQRIQTYQGKGFLQAGAGTVAFFDVRVSNVKAESNINLTTETILRRAENEKRELTANG